MSFDTAGSTDRSLLRLVQRREPEAWGKFVALYGPHVYGWSRRYGLSVDDAADVTQETLLAVSRAIEQFRYRDAGSSLRGWLWTIMRNETRDWLRRREQAVRAAGGSSMHARMQEWPETPPDDSDAAESMHTAQLVHRGLAQIQGDFEPRTWEAFRRVAIDGLDTAEVAARLGMSANHVRQCRSRVLRRLREHLDADNSPLGPVPLDETLH